MNILKKTKKSCNRLKLIYESVKISPCLISSRTCSKNETGRKLLRLKEAATTGSVQANELTRISRPSGNEH